MIVDQDNPERAQEIARQQFEDAKKLLWEDSAAVEMLMDISTLMPEWRISTTIDEFTEEGFDPGVRLTGPQTTRAVGRTWTLSEQNTERRDVGRSFVFATGLTSRPGFLAVGSGRDGTYQDVVGGKPVGERSLGSSSASVVVPGTENNQGFVARAIRGFAKSSGCIPPPEKAAQFSAIFEKYL